VREVNPDLSRQLNAVVTQDPGQAPVQTLNGSDFSAVPVTKASEVTTTGTDTATREPVQTQVVAKVPLTEVGKTVVRQVRMTGLQQDRTVTVKLIPESLGEVHLEIRTHGDETTVRMASNNAAVRDTLESQMHLLREALMREGVDVQKVHVTSSLAANNGAPAGQHQTHSQQQSQWGDGRQHSSSHQQRGGESFQQGNHAPENPRQNARNDGSLNLFV
jgi:flagellar hook-length control protein FliK